MQKNLLEYLENTAALYGEKPAFIDEKRSVSFKALEAAAKAIGTAIAKETGAFNRPCAVITDRSILPIFGFMGALYSGNCYVPIDSRMPPARLDSLMASLQPACILYPKEHEALARAYKEYPNMEIEAAMQMTADERLLEGLRRRTIDLDPAYIIFTSGSTGVPKGIVISHRSVIDFTDWYRETMGIGAEDRLGNQAPFYFDLSVKDLYTTLATGATAHILPQKFFIFPKLLMQYIAEQQITTLSWATSAFHLIANSKVLETQAPSCLKRVILGGEALQAKQLNIWRRALPEVQYVNLYGPTEVTVDCTYYIIDRAFEDTEPIPIGYPCRNKEILLLDENRRPVPDGTPGEICVRGSGIACGYYGDAEKTGKAFIQNPLNPYYRDLLYCTGDLAVRGEDGALRFLARKDHQIKHGGYRIELGEIEITLSGVGQVDAVVCLFDQERDKIVCVFAGGLEEEALAKEARARLPKYMVPNLYIKRETMPYTGGGKLDRVRLTEEYHEKNNRL